MSVYKKDTEIERFPAYVIYQRDKIHKGENEYIEITAEDVLGSRHPRGYYDLYSPGSVIDYARQYNECPFEALEEESKKYGAKMYWLLEHSVVISDTPRAPKRVVKVEAGDVVRFHGKMFTIIKNPYGRLELKQHV